ncbi:hypothetical protein ISN44_As08g036380 [Arabidopsis suecica]|uniref:Uncharacterized protein n=1 Tax=Arabidopsis suecica TaxID=45249 RepID=A0A8T2BDW5_ARASU|nr:hypothetical protein ISN44_As08g036380 [Arabidopsis suecica]
MLKSPTRGSTMSSETHRLPKTSAAATSSSLVDELREDTKAKSTTSSTVFQPIRPHAHLTGATTASEGRGFSNSDTGIETSSQLSPLETHDLKLRSIPAITRQTKRSYQPEKQPHPLEEKKVIDPAKVTRSRPHKLNRREAYASKLTKATNHRRKDDTREVTKPNPPRTTSESSAVPSNRRRSESSSHHGFSSQHAPPQLQIHHYEPRSDTKDSNSGEDRQADERKLERPTTGE